MRSCRSYLSYSLFVWVRCSSVLVAGWLLVGSDVEQIVRVNDVGDAEEDVW